MRKLGNALGVAACFGLFACASGGGSGTGATKTSEKPTAPAATAEPSGVRLAAVRVEPGEASTVVRLGAEGPISIYSSYNPEPSLVVVDVPNGTFPENASEAASADPRIRSMRVSHLTEFGRPFARLELRTIDGAEADVVRDGTDIVVRLTGGSPSAAPAPESVTAEALPPSSPQETVKDEIAPAATAPAPASVAPAKAASSPEPVVVKASSKPSGRKATRLDRVGAAWDGSRTVLELAGDGDFAIRDFWLENPTRLVLDLDGVQNKFGKKSVEVGRSGVGRARISQFQTGEAPICRVVLDLDRRIGYRLEPTKRGVRLVVEGDPAPRPEPVMAAAPAITEPTPETTTASSEPSVEAPTPAPDARTGTVADAAIEPAHETTEPAAAEPVAVVAEAKPEAAPSAPKAAPEPAKRPEPSAPAVRPQHAVADDALYEAAESFLADAKGAEVTGGKFAQATQTAPTQQAYFGEPISLHLKDNDIRDVLRTISNLTSLNMVIDPQVNGKVTIDLEEVPWDQALELILRVNDLSYQFDGNVMRIGQTAKLKTEEAMRRALEEEKELAQPQRTVVKTISYAKADELVQLVRSVLSKRGNVIVDTRTNNLVISDIQRYIDSALQLIDTLDVPNRQVVIEARIVETTKQFSRSLGINWGLTGVADQAHGNQTGLQFPSDIGIGLGMGLGVPSSGVGGGPILDLALGSILDTFNLDLALSAAENEGVAKVISAPRIATETNYAATIQSGVQIPVQTTANNTTTVSYQDATLRLNVTPQITASGTIIMDLDVTKRQPIGLLVSGATNVPLVNRSARTRLLVRDGETAVIGGIYEISNDENSNRLPGLWDIPILGLLFKNEQKSNRHDELLIFITPRIVK